MAYVRYYNSTTGSLGPAAFAIGSQWRDSFSRRIVRQPGSLLLVTVARPDGKVLLFRHPAAQGADWLSSGDINGSRLRAIYDAGSNLTGWRYTEEDDTIELYNATGVLQSITSRAGVLQTIAGAVRKA